MLREALLLELEERVALPLADVDIERDGVLVAAAEPRLLREDDGEDVLLTDAVGEEVPEGEGDTIADADTQADALAEGDADADVVAEAEGSVETDALADELALPETR